MIFLHRASALSTGIKAGDLEVGQEVLLNENGAPANYLVVHQGLPSDLYDASCEGTWLLRKDIYENRQWHSSNVNDYANSTIHSYLNSTFLNLFDAKVIEAIKQVKIPYVNGTGSEGSVASGANGLSCKIFLLSGYEVGFSTSDNQYFPVDGAKLSYFDAGTGSTANSKRVANYNSSATDWWLRSLNNNYATGAWRVLSSGNCNGGDCSVSYGIRHNMILPYDFTFQESEVA